MYAAIDRGNNQSAKVEGAWKQLQQEAFDKAKLGQARIVEWDTIKASLPAKLKVLPLTVVPHKFYELY